MNAPKVESENKLHEDFIKKPNWNILDPICLNVTHGTKQERMFLKVLKELT